MLGIAAIVLTVALIVGIVEVTQSFDKAKEIALKKGVEADDISSLKIALWLYVLPPIFMLLFSNLANILVMLVLLVFYAPGMLMARNLSRKMSRGADFERKAGVEFAKGIWLGLGGIGLVFLYWALAAVSTSMTAPKPVM